MGQWERDQEDQRGKNNEGYRPVLRGLCEETRNS